MLYDYSRTKKIQKRVDKEVINNNHCGIAVVDEEQYHMNS